MDENLKKQLEDLQNRIEEAESNVNASKNILNRIYEDYLRVDYTQIEGETGKFNGVAMVTSEGKEFKVNENYAAKSKLVYGDELKLIEQDGKNIFKQIEKVEKERVEGILTKKEGEWYLLTDRGSHRVSDAAAEYHKAELNSQAVAFLPKDNPKAPFATIDTVEGPSVIKEDKSEEKSVPSEDSNKKQEDIKKMDKKEMDLKKKTKTKNKPAKSGSTPRPAPKPTPKQTPRPAPKPKTKSSSKSSRSKDAPSDTSTDDSKASSKKKKILGDDDLV